MTNRGTLRTWLALLALAVGVIPFMACKITVVESPDDVVCGDGVCDADEDGDSCAADCAVAPVAVCGDGACDEGEGFASCAEDCVPEVGYDVTRAPVGVDELLSQDVVNEILDTGMNLYEGNAPPSVVGRYRADSLKILYDGLQGNPDSNIMPYEIDITETDGILMICTYQDNSEGSECSVNAYLSGAGVCFTLVADYAGRANACEYDRTELISGCMDESGNIADYQSAFFLTNHAGECDGIRAEYVLRVLDEDDQLVEAITD
ncbi:MAG: hypothetical protein VX938_00765 [Myxococcota bacterium]|nr:hypothetical protein [Myxococcota bacterium]